MNPLPTLLVWGVLVAMIVAEIVLSVFAATRPAVPYIGIATAILTALTFMRLGSSRGLVPAIALAGTFWLCIMLGLGSLDAFTRHDIPVPQRTDSAQHGNPTPR